MILLRLAACCLYATIGYAASAIEQWRTNGGVRHATLAVPQNGKAGFTLLDPNATGITFTNSLHDRSVVENQVRLNGSGVALGDVDGDGRCDIYLCRLEGPNALYRNLGGWKFEDIAVAAGVTCPSQYSTGALLGDLDGDGDLDLLVNSMVAGTRCFLNNGKGRFTESNSGLLKKHCATSMALADIDGNGSLDLYVANYRTNTIRSTGLQVLNVNGRRMLRPQDREGYEITPAGLILEHAEPDVLYTNDGRGNFTAVSWTDGRFLDERGIPITRADRDWGLSVIMRDLNGDRAPDIYVCNDFWSSDGIWFNDGRGGFRAASVFDIRSTSTFSMGVDVADINRDGFDDFVVLDMRSREHARRMRQRSMLEENGGVPGVNERVQVERNTLFLSRGDGSFAEIAQLAGLQASEWSWCPVFLDVDLDGYEDLLITTGHGFDSQDTDTEERLARGARIPLGERILQYPRLLLPKQAFRNRGDLTFGPAGDAWAFNQPGISHGMATADLDGDGDLDAVVNNMNGAAGIYRNESGAPRLMVRLRGSLPNTQGIGARIEVIGGSMRQTQEIMSGGRYLSCDDSVRTFAAWNATNRFTVTVKWRNGTVSSAVDMPGNSLVEITEPQGSQPAPVAQEAQPVTWFRDESVALSHLHRDEAFDDFARQALLPKRLSHFGPGIAWGDVNSDEFDDLIIGAGASGAMGVYTNVGGTRFAPISISTNSQTDQTGIVAVRQRGRVMIVAGQSNYESGDTNIASAAMFLMSTNLSSLIKPTNFAAPSSSGPIAMADVDRDGDLDLFVGGHVQPGRYPQPAASRLYQNSNGVFVLAHEWQNLGLVNGAIFTDLTGDSAPDLALACEWGSPLVFRNERGQFSAIDLGLSQFRGLWTGITSADFDGDGRLDLVVGNWGRNTPYQSFAPHPIRLYYADFTDSGRIDGIESYVESNRELPWRDLDRMSTALPWLRGRLQSYAEFGRATFAHVMGDALAQAKVLEARVFDSMLFLNHGQKLEARPLPMHVQFSPVFGLAAGDFDGDAAIDLFAAQNFSAVAGDASRYDAGLGVMLKGSGTGEFVSVSPRISGLRIHGDQRGAASADYNRDGRLDLVVGQNNAGTLLFRNQTARPALRVRLSGPVGNEAGIGGLVRRVDGTRRGPAHEIRAGNGWWSQDAATVLLAGSGTNVWVRWPSGQEATIPIPSNASAVTLHPNGTATISK